MLLNYVQIVRNSVWEGIERWEISSYKEADFGKKNQNNNIFILSI